MENNWLNLMNLLKMILLSREIRYYLETKEKNNKSERASVFDSIKDKIDPSKLIYEFMIYERYY